MCQAVRYDIAVADGLTEDLVDQVSKQGIPSRSAGERQELIVRFVDWYVLSPSAHDADLKRCLNEQFSEAEQVHLATVNGLF